jgi:hypothetical protein
MQSVSALFRRAAFALAPLVVVAGVLAPTARAQSPDAAFEPSRWTVDAPRAEFVEHLGRRSLRLASGSALLNGVQLQDGVIEVDVSAPAGGFAFIFFRAPSAVDREDVYLRMGASGRADAVQYQPTYGRTGAWQLYHGPGYTAPATFDPRRWTRLRVEVDGRQARVFVGDSARAPALVVSDLKRGVALGAIGVLEGTAAVNVPGIYLSNFRYAARPPATSAPSAPAGPAPSVAPGAIRRWEISPVVAVDRASVELLPASARALRRDWIVAEAEPDGLLNLARYRTTVGPRSLVYARAVIRADRAEVRRLAFGYSDDVTVFLNGRPLFAGRNGFGARYPSAAGLMTPDDAVFLPLRRGENELVMAVAEEFGGWGIIARLEAAVPGAPTSVGAALRPSAPAPSALGCVATGPSPSAGALAPERDAVGALVRAFRRHAVVAVGETHRIQEMHDFLTRLLRDPRLAGAADDIVVEFGNARYQPLIDR